MSSNRIITLSGGVGGAKLVLGLAHALPAERLLVVTNTGDDFNHLGLSICPDTDTVLYTLSGLANPEQGWGRVNETWTFMQTIRDLGGSDWFNLGDGDVALHVLRTCKLAEGATLTEVTRDIAHSLNIDVPIIPMCDQSVSTMVKTPDGLLPFQDYFVRDRCAPIVNGFLFEGIEAARPNPVLMSALTEEPSAIVIAPSNPYVSVDPILGIPDMRDLLRKSGAPIIAVSPIIGGQAIKGPAAKMMGELGLTASAVEIARHYKDFIDALIIDEEDSELAPAIAEMGIEVEVAPTLMKSLDDRIDLANLTLSVAARLNGGVER